MTEGDTGATDTGATDTGATEMTKKCKDLQTAMNNVKGQKIIKFF